MMDNVSFQQRNQHPMTYEGIQDLATGNEVQVLNTIGSVVSPCLFPRMQDIFT